jgi:hypothetical protein
MTNKQVLLRANYMAFEESLGDMGYVTVMSDREVTHGWVTEMRRDVIQCWITGS